VHALNGVAALPARGETTSVEELQVSNVWWISALIGSAYLLRTMLNSPRLKSTDFDGEQSSMRPLSLVICRIERREILYVFARQPLPELDMIKENAKEI
jgi:hypothetical protein